MTLKTTFWMNSRPIFCHFIPKLYHNGKEMTPDNEGIKLTDEGLQYRYPSVLSQANQARMATWITVPFPVHCCDEDFATRAEFEAHCLDLRHYERMKDQRGEGRLPDYMIDPRLLVTQEAFDALPWREQFKRMRRYVDAIVPAIKARCDPVNWSEADRATMMELAQSGGQLLYTCAEEM